jgi:hypothetical protein
MPSQNISIFALPLLLTAEVKKGAFVDIGGKTAEPGGYALGVAYVDGSAGEAVAVDVLGTAQVVAGGSIAVGAEIEVGADGKAVTRASGTLVGRALQAATSAGDVIEILLIQS